MVVVVGLPLEVGAKLYNVAAVLYEGEILGVVPKSNIPNYSEFYEARHFQPGSPHVKNDRFMRKPGTLWHEPSVQMPGY